MDNVNDESTSALEVEQLREQVRRLTIALDQAHHRYEELVASTAEPKQVAPRRDEQPGEVEELLRTKTFRFMRPLRVLYGGVRFRSRDRVPKTPKAR